MSNYNRITFKERMKIEAGIYTGKSFSLIAKEPGRSTSSISREVKQNRLMVKAPYGWGKDCIRAWECKKTGLCRNKYCRQKGWTCTEFDCTQDCKGRISHTCNKTNRAPFVCDACEKKNKKTCRYNKYYYFADKAEAKAKKIRSESRSGIRLSQKELRTSDDILSPLIRQGQPLSHICNTHKEEIMVSERSIYNYIEAGELTVSSLDLRRKVRYRRRRKKQEKIKCRGFHYRQGRTFDDFRRYMEENPHTPVVEMDTVRGLRSKEQVLLTLMFTDTSVMLMILIREEAMEPVIEVFDRLRRYWGSNDSENCFL